MVQRRYAALLRATGRLLTLARRILATACWAAAATAAGVPRATNATLPAMPPEEAEGKGMALCLAGRRLLTVLLERRCLAAAVGAISTA